MKEEGGGRRGRKEGREEEDRRANYLSVELFDSNISKALCCTQINRRKGTLS
jgi:hypothetical protein